MGVRSASLEALPVDNGRAGLVVLLLADPHGLEGGQRGEDGATDPNGVLALRWSNDLDLHGAGRHRRDLLLHAVGNTREHGRATGHDGVGVQVLTDIDVALHDGVEGRLVDAARLHAQEGRLEQRLRATETLVADRDDLKTHTTFCDLSELLPYTQLPKKRLPKKKTTTQYDIALFITRSISVARQDQQSLNITNHEFLLGRMQLPPPHNNRQILQKQ